MVTIRDTLARRNAGGPQFKYIPQRIVVEVGNGLSVSDIASESDEFAGHMLDTPPVGEDVMSKVENKLQDIDFNTRRLDNTGTIIAEADRLATVIENIKSQASEFSDKSINKLEKLEKKAKNAGNFTILDGFRPGMFNFQSSDDRDFEAKLRNSLLGDLHNPITDAVQDIQNVVSVEVSHTVNTPGPKNLGVDVYDTSLNVLDSDGDKPHVGDAVKKMGAKEAWEVSTGENAVVAIFDTSFAEEFVKSDRVIDTFHGEDVDSAYSAPEEGHGTMTAYSAAGNAKDTDKVDYSGVAKDADLLLARLSDSSGGLVYTEEAWDWLAGWIKALDRPVISNHSYGIPLCSARGQDLCNTVVGSMSEALSKRDDHQAIYAAGNEAQYCGHRLSGVTNGIAGINSSESSIAVAAFRYDLNGAQVYSSHGFGRCTDKLTDPKPDIGCLLPSIVPYGEDVKDMSSGNGGSNAGTSEAAPLTAGLAALIASTTGNAKTEVIEGILESTAELPRKTQVNAVAGYDARFGRGQVRGGKAIRQAEVLEPQEAPNAVFTYQPTTPTVGETVTFDASASTDPNEDIEEYQWNFGDGSTSTGQTVQHVFSDNGNTTVTLTVVDSLNQESTYTLELYVNAEPEAEFNVSPEEALEGQIVRFDATESTDPDNDIETYEWDLGDGTTADGEVIEHQYNSSDTYTATLTVTDSVGNQSSTSSTVSVTAAPTPRINYEPEDPVIGESVRFDATGSTDPNGDIVNYSWNFGDGSVSRGAVVDHQYSDFGNYTVTLIVEDSAGNERSTSESIYVGASPTAEFIYDPQMPTREQSVTFDASPSTDPDNQIESYNWDFGDGSQAEGETVEKRYAEVGQYNVVLNIEDEAGNASSASRVVEVTAEPNPEFVMEPDTPTPMESITLDASGSVDVDDDITSYDWELGNGSQAEGEVVDVTYTEPGEYDVTLTATDQLGNEDSVTQTLRVYAEPEAQFQYSPQDPTTSDAITFNASGTTDEDGDISNYMWSFSNGETESGEVVQRMYSDPGSYTVELIVEDEAGNRDTATKSVNISEETGESTEDKDSDSTSDTGSDGTDSEETKE